MSIIDATPTGLADSICRHAPSTRHESAVALRATLIAMATSGWFGVRCVFKIDGDQEATYEERITVWRADSPEEAIESAEAEAAQYVDGLDAEYLGLAQVYTMADGLVDGAEVFSLMRTSSLEPTRYLYTYFDTGAERQTDVAAPETGSAQRGMRAWPDPDP